MSEQRLCACGCGQEIVIQKHHKRYGIPRFIHGHNGAKKSFEERQKLKNKPPQIVQHHIHYKEIDGYDEIVLLTKSEHSKLHYNLRKNKKLTVPVGVLEPISVKAHQRTQHYKEYKKQYRKSGKDQRIMFTETVCPNIQLFEQIDYFSETGNVSYYSVFRGTHGLKTVEVDL